MAFSDQDADRAFAEFIMNRSWWFDSYWFGPSVRAGGAILCLISLFTSGEYFVRFILPWGTRFAYAANVGLGYFVFFREDTSPFMQVPGRDSFAVFGLVHGIEGAYDLITVVFPWLRGLTGLLRITKVPPFFVPETNWAYFWFYPFTIVRVLTYYAASVYKPLPLNLSLWTLLLTFLPLFLLLSLSTIYSPTSFSTPFDGPSLAQIWSYFWQNWKWTLVADTAFVMGGKWTYNTLTRYTVRGKSLREMQREDAGETVAKSLHLAIISRFLATGTLFLPRLRPETYHNILLRFLSSDFAVYYWQPRMLMLTMALEKWTRDVVREGMQKEVEAVLEEQARAKDDDATRT